MAATHPLLQGAIQTFSFVFFKVTQTAVTQNRARNGKLTNWYSTEHFSVDTVEHLIFLFFFFVNNFLQGVSLLTKSYKIWIIHVFNLIAVLTKQKSNEEMFGCLNKLGAENKLSSQKYQVIMHLLCLSSAFRVRHIQPFVDFFICCGVLLVKQVWNLKRKICLFYNKRSWLQSRIPTRRGEDWIIIFLSVIVFHKWGACLKMSSSFHSSLKLPTKTVNNSKINNTFWGNTITVFTPRGIYYSEVRFFIKPCILALFIFLQSKVVPQKPYLVWNDSLVRHSGVQWSIFQLTKQVWQEASTSAHFTATVCYNVTLHFMGPIK